MSTYTPHPSRQSQEATTEFVGYALGGRLGWAHRWMILTFDAFAAMGWEDPLFLVDSVGGTMLQCGITLGFPLRQFLVFEIGTHLTYFRLRRRNLQADAVFFPLQIGLTFRVPFKFFCLGLRIVSVHSFDFFERGQVIGGFANLVLETS